VGVVPFKYHQPPSAPLHTATNPWAEQDLVDALRRRDETAYRILVRRYTPLMLRLARPHVPSQAIAEEVVQDTWLAVLRGIDAFECRARFSTWLMRILLNTARKRGVREHTPVRWDALSATHEQDPASEVSPESTALCAETRAVIEQAIRALPVRQRTVLVLRDVEGWPAPKVCAELGVSAGNQRVLLHRARAAVRATLAPRLDDLGIADLIPA
jgi:RNA polymerase sigma-70 factor (ECF subfamily)